jgi:hypothetical protein
MLLAALLEACQEAARFSHLKEMPYVKENRLAYNVITVDMATNVWNIPGVQLLFDIIDTVTRQKLTATTKAAALFEAPDPWSSLSEHHTKIAPSLRALGDAKLLTATALIRQQQRRPYHRKAYQLGANDLRDLLADDPSPLTMEKMNKITEKIRRAFDDRKLAPTPKPTASSAVKLTRFETKRPAPNTVSKTTSAPKPARDFLGETDPPGEGLGEGERGEEREILTRYSVTCALSSGTDG